MIKNFINFDDLSFKDLQGIIDQAISLKKLHKYNYDTLKHSMCKI